MTKEVGESWSGMKSEESAFINGNAKRATSRVCGVVDAVLFIAVLKPCDGVVVGFECRSQELWW